MRAGCTWPACSILPPGTWWAGRWAPTTTPGWSPVPWTRRWPAAAAAGWTPRSSILIAAPNTPRRPAVPPATGWGCANRWAAPAPAWTTPSPSRSSPPSRSSWSTAAPLAPELRPGPRSSAGSPGIAVGTALAGGPPRRSQRALLTHWAPDLGSGVEALVGPGVHVAGGREPSFRVAAHLLPVEAVSLAAAPKRPIPVPHELVAEGRHLVDVARDRVVGEVASHHRPEPASLCLDGPVAALHQQDLGLA